MLGVYFPAVAIFWIYGLFEAISHCGYAYNCQETPKQLSDAFYFGTLKEALVSGVHLLFVSWLVAASILTRFDFGIVALLVSMHVVFTISGLRGGHAKTTLAHGYEYGLIPFKSPLIFGYGRVMGHFTKFTAHLDISLHIYLVVRLGMLLPIWFVVPVLLVGAFIWRRIMFDALVTKVWYNGLVYTSHIAIVAVLLASL